MHYMDVNETYGEKARWELYLNATNYFGQTLEAQPTKQHLYDHLSLISQTTQVRRTRHAGHGWRNKDKLIGDFLWWTPTHGRASVSQPARTYWLLLSPDVFWGTCQVRWKIGMNGEIQGNPCCQRNLMMTLIIEFDSYLELIYCILVPGYVKYLLVTQGRVVVNKQVSKTIACTVNLSLFVYSISVG